ncbi:FMN-linked oxidoreductase [Dendrothele bispora CBS 962.96]|uniref:tRNA-dihydrouridine(16/17) synthase [NAD(P)(+)] n=1 Tax=Dendrothele bispora (strain CBS 962.96) TaxID=1314807 RepID=A0A4S8LY11_DENBC|nr:FMN-linked oxidoreductase [Dendrothele bispora CBS 962.96]
MLEGHCDAVDINLGCPQDVAKKGRYGAFLIDDWDLIYKLINTLHTNLSIPVTAKFRVLPTVEKTVEYAKMLERAGAQILTCHGRLKEQRGQASGLADWSKIKGVKEARLSQYSSSPTAASSSNLTLKIVFVRPVPTSLRTRTSVSAVKGHLFKLMRPALSRETDLRERMGKVKIGGKDADRDAEAVEGKTLEELVMIDEPTGLRVLPHWLAQPYFRPPPPPPPPKKEKEPKPKLSTNLSASLPAAETTVVVPAKRTI